MTGGSSFHTKKSRIEMSFIHHSSKLIDSKTTRNLMLCIGYDEFDDLESRLMMNELSKKYSTNTRFSIVPK